LVWRGAMPPATPRSVHGSRGERQTGHPPGVAPEAFTSGLPRPPARGGPTL